MRQCAPRPGNLGPPCRAQPCRMACRNDRSVTYPLAPRDHALHAFDAASWDAHALAVVAFGSCAMNLLTALSLLSLLLCGAIFGFFYAWVCSTMWGLDTVNARVAIEAMQAMNASVRNAVFAPAFFGTPVVLAGTAGLAWLSSERTVATWLGSAALLYVIGAFLPTLHVNVPMNEALARVDLKQSSETLQQVWGDYSTRWQRWNQIRTLASGGAVLFVGAALMRLGRAV